MNKLETIGRPAVAAAVAAIVAAAPGAPPGARGEWVIDGYTAGPSIPATVGTHSVARLWMEQMLEAIRNDFARPTVHARNLFHVSVAMWDAWAVYSVNAYPFLTAERHADDDVQAAREEAISFAAYRVLQARFGKSPGADVTLPALDGLMDKLGYDRNFHGTVGASPRAVGNRIAVNVLSFGLADHSNEQGGYANLHYAPINEPLLPELPGNPEMDDPNRWQPLALDFFIDQNGNIIIGGFPPALSPEWGQVSPFALSAGDLTIYNRPPPAPDADFDYWVYHDPGPPPLLGGVGDAAYKWGHEQVAIWSGHLDPTDGVLWDISPGAIGNSPTPDPADYATYYDLYGGGDSGTGFPVNPVTGRAYRPQIVPRGDYARCLAEFWADGPSSETPPGHWFAVANYVSDHPLVEKRLGGTGPILPDLEWDVKVYLALGGAMHDTAVSVWGTKGWYDSSRPISAIRYMTDRGQCSDPDDVETFDPSGIDLHAGFVELVTPETTLPGERHEHLAGHEGKVALLAWRGPAYISDPETETAGVAWILAENWWPYQRPTFVTPPFPGYTSGHSAYSRAAAEVLTNLTGSPYFPGGLGGFHCPRNQYLVFEEGPSVDVTLQWALYSDGATQSALSRIWGGIHPGFDDLPSRIIGAQTGPDAFGLASEHFEGSGYVPCPADLDANSGVDMVDLLNLFRQWGTDPGGPPDLDGDGTVGPKDLGALLDSWGPCPS